MNKADKPFAADAVWAVLLLALPWLNPFTYGPTPAVAQGLVVWLAAAVCWLLCEWSGVNFSARVRLLATAWLLAAALSAAMGLLQYLGLSGSWSPWVDFVDAGQAYANLRQRNQLATLLGIGLSALLWWQLTTGPVPGERFLRLVWLGGLALLLAAADAASASRTGFVQLLLLFGLSLLWRRGRGTMLWALIAYSLAGLVLPFLMPHAPMSAQATLQSGILGRVGEASGRGILWHNVLHLIALKPWLGWGWGELHFAHFITLYPGERFDQILGNAHNLPLQLAVELGLPLALAFCAALLWLVLRAKPWREQDLTRQMAWSVLAVIFVHSMLEYPLWYGPFQLAAVAAVWMLWHSRPGKVAGPVSHGVAKLPMALATCTLLACSYAAWDYWRISQIYLPVAQRASAYRDDTLSKISDSWLFQGQLRFAELGITALTADNAEHVHALAKEMLHFSPEASVVQKLIDSATLLGQHDEAAYYEKRFQAAYPPEYAAWLATRSSARRQAP